MLPAIVPLTESQKGIYLECVNDPETIRSKRGDLFADGKPYRTFTVEELLRGSGEDNPDLPISPDQLAYCIYTSGSTGKPKGVMIEHHNFTNMIYGHQQIVRYFHHAGNGTCLASCSVSFDASVLDTFLPLCTGKHLVICTDAEHLNPLSMRDLMLKYGVEFLVSTPSYLSNLAGMPELRPAFAGLKSIIVGAEAFPATLYEALRGASPDMEIINGYGPSECTVCCSYKKSPTRRTSRSVSRRRTWNCSSATNSATFSRPTRSAN